MSRDVHVGGPRCGKSWRASEEARWEEAVETCCRRLHGTIVSDLGLNGRPHLLPRSYWSEQLVLLARREREP